MKRSHANNFNYMIKYVYRIFTEIYKISRKSKHSKKKVHDIIKAGKITNNILDNFSTRRKPRKKDRGFYFHKSTNDKHSSKFYNVTAVSCFSCFSLWQTHRLSFMRMSHAPKTTKI